MSVHCNDGLTTWLTKLECIGELSAANKQIVFNNLGHLLTVDMWKILYSQLDGRKAVGIDNVTKMIYGTKLDENLNALILKIRRGIYKPKPARITQIPKEDGSFRPLAISCFEDKLVQLAVSTILNKIYEPIFLPCSYGFRPEQSCHDALKALNKSAFRNWNGTIIEIDLRKYFNRIPHCELMKFLRNKISDKRFLRLIEIIITMPTIEENTETPNILGCPQGSVASPILANLYLHYVIDEWFEEIKTTHFNGRAETIRYADDMVFTFEKQSDAKRFYEVLPKRLAKYGLEMHVDKSQMIPAGHTAASKAAKKGDRLPTFSFLGFTCYWGKSKNGYWRLKYTSRRDRFAAKLKGTKKFLDDNLNTENTAALLKTVIRGIKGWINYHGISDNQRRVGQYITKCKYIIFRWLNRRGRKKPLTWEKFTVILKAINFPKHWKTVSMY